MIVIDGYSIEQYPNSNRITINLPQTIYTVRDTICFPQHRRIKLTREELTALLVCVKVMYENGMKDGEEDGC